MDDNRYCKNCHSVVEFEYGKETAVCPECGQEVKLKDTLAGWTREARMAQVRAMHEIMCNANDENIYMTWIISGCPDCASEEDIEYIAMDDESYEETFDLFVKLIRKKGNRW